LFQGELLFLFFSSQAGEEIHQTSGKPNYSGKELQASSTICAEEGKFCARPT
jgi:hypothetical protein